MDVSRWTSGKVFIYYHPVDTRKGVAGLAVIVSLELGRVPVDRSRYVSIIRSRNKVRLYRHPGSLSQCLLNYLSCREKCSYLLIPVLNSKLLCYSNATQYLR